MVLILNINIFVFTRYNTILNGVGLIFGILAYYICVIISNYIPT